MQYFEGHIKNKNNQTLTSITITLHKIPLTSLLTYNPISQRTYKHSRSSGSLTKITVNVGYRRFLNQKEPPIEDKVENTTKHFRLKRLQDKTWNLFVDLCREIPLFTEFNSKKFLKFYLYKLHHFFDGLIDYMTLTSLNIQLNSRTRNFKTSEPPLSHCDDKENFLFFARIELRNSGWVRISLAISSGHIPKQNFSFVSSRKGQ